jgi:hypothetical protein
MKTKLLALIAGSVALASGPALAHHSFAMFDRDKEVTIVGTVKEFQWTNPHSWIQVNVPNKAGKMVEWSIEGGSPNIMVRQGWKRDIMKPGDKVTVVLNPMKDGSPGGSLVRVTMPSGLTLPPKAP